MKERKNLNLVALSGKKNSGKDESGQMIQFIMSKAYGKCTYDEFKEHCKERDRFHEYGFRVQNGEVYTYVEVEYKIKRFADKLKDIVCMLIGCTREELEDRNFKEKELDESWDKLKVTYSDGYDEVTDIFDFDFDFNTLSDAKGKAIYIHKKEILKMTARQLLQEVGTDAMRNIIHPNIWVNSLFSDWKPYETIDMNEDMSKSCNNYDIPKWIITDARFPNEAERVLNEGGLLIRINRHIGRRVQVGKIIGTVVSRDYDGLIYVKSDNDVIYKMDKGLLDFITEDEHESETALDSYQKFDYVIDNDWTLNDLLNKLKEIIDKEHNKIHQMADSTSS